jgi:hypothetical protein
MAGQALLEALIDRGYAYDVAAKMLGLDKQQGNPKYAISLGGMKINPIRMIANQGIRSIMSGGKMSGMGMGLPLIAAGLGLGYMRNPLRPGSMNYNPELQGQIDYALNRGYIRNNPSSGLGQYSDNSILSGQNVVSMFGTNDYGKQLQKYRNKYGKTMPKERLEQLDREIQDQITDDFDKTDAFMETIKPKTPVYTPSPGDNGGGGGNNNYGGATQSGGFDPGGFEQDGTGRQGYNRGGIASL